MPKAKKESSMWNQELFTFTGPSNFTTQYYVLHLVGYPPGRSCRWAVLTRECHQGFLQHLCSFFFFFPSRPAAGLLLLLSLSREHHRFIGISVRLLLLSSPWVPFLLDIGPRSHFHGYLTFKELCLLAGYFKYSARRSHHMHTFPHILYLILCYSRSCCSVKCAQNCTFYSKQKWTQFLFLNLIH